MQPTSTVFSQIMDILFASEFARCAHRVPTPRSPRSFTAYDHFLVLCFGQLTYRESLRDIVVCLNAKSRQLYHLGFRGRVSRTNIAYANHHRDWQLFQMLAEVLMRRAARLYSDTPSDPDWPAVAYALDSSIISLSLDLFPWGYYARSRQAAVKLHLLLSLQGNVPAWAAITQAHFPDMKILDQLPALAGAYYVMDRGYLDFVRLCRLHQAGSYFVVRNKRHVQYQVLQHRAVEPNSNILSDDTIQLTSRWSAQSYPQPLRRVCVYDPQNKVSLVLLTNQLNLPALLIAQLYRKRWQVELFFKWIKQHLRIRAFYGRSQNAVRCQVWSAICAYLMVAILKKSLKTTKTLNEMLQIISVSIFEQVPLHELLATNPSPCGPGTTEDHLQNLLAINDK
jgi:Transposase DDE domain/Domain of unknown function (DUF4372)